jgi:hypothetical protein
MAIALPNVTVGISIDWKTISGDPVHAVPSVQVVSQHFLFRGSNDSIYTQSWASLKDLEARNVRFAAWFPYARAGIAELSPPSSTNLCSPAASAEGPQTRPFTMSCGPYGGTISKIESALYGSPSGTCGAYKASTCNLDISQTVSTICLNQNSCNIMPSNFPSVNCTTSPYFALQFACSNSSQQFTSWNFDDVDDFFLDFWSNVDGDNSDPIVSFSTAPTWLYNTTSWDFPDSLYQPWYGYNRGNAPSTDLQAYGDYYGRLYSWYMKGSFLDEYNNLVQSNRPKNFSVRYIEIGNEVDYEHGHTAESYTLEFDAVVKSITAFVDPSQQIKYNGMNLPNIDDTDQVASWATYFLNKSNHDVSVASNPNAFHSIGYHAYPTSQYKFTSDPNSFAQVFLYIDDVFIPKILTLDAIIAALSPNTRTFLDECGLDMDQVLSAGSPPDNSPRYWVVSGSYFAYLFARVLELHTTVDQVGHSQLMDAPGQEPSVTLLDWASGRGTAAYWTTWLVIRAFALGDSLTKSTSSNFTNVYARSYLHTSEPGRPDLVLNSTNQHRLLLINKINNFATVSVPVSAGVSKCTMFVVDERTRLDAPIQSDLTIDGNQVTTQLYPYATAILIFNN